MSDGSAAGDRGEALERLEIPGYSLVHRLGRGGMGEVHEAEDLASGERVAIKVLLHGGVRSVAALRSEIDTLVGLRHEGVVRLLDCGETHGRPWYAMELIAGVTLRQHLKMARDGISSSAQSDPTEDDHDWWTNTAFGVGATVPYAGPLAIDHASSTAELATQPVQDVPVIGLALLPVMHRVAAALAFLHEHGVIHCDLKPENIVIRHGDQRPVLIDFGLARPLQHDGREVLDVRATNVGSVCYMAPEQVTGQHLDARTDVYALGCILYEAMCGRPPFTGLRANVLHNHVATVPPRLADVLAEPPAGLDALVARMLAKKPDDRPLAMAEVAAVLGGLVSAPRSDEEAEDPGVLQGQVRLQRPPLAGRAADLQRLVALASPALSGRGQLVVVRGQSGVGKTRLGAELVSAARNLGFRVLGGHGRPVAADRDSGSVHGHPLEVLAPLFDAILDGVVAAPEGPLAAAAQRHAPVVSMFLPRWRSHFGSAQPPAAAQVLVALRDLVAVFAAQQPILLLLDDLQWADQLTLALLQFLVDSRYDWGQLAVVGMCRSEELDGAL